MYAGRVGTGFDQASLEAIYTQLKARARKTSPLHKPLTSAQARGVQWVEPTLVERNSLPSGPVTVWCATPRFHGPAQ